MAREDGQAAAEMAALLPLVAAVLLVAWQFVLAGDARSSAAAAARAAARAAAVGADPAAAVTVSVRVPALAAPIDLGRVRARASLEAAE
jgi:uncharacterized protein (UPF0333 family)